MSVFKMFQEFYLSVKENREWKEHHWHFLKSTHHIRFGHNPHFLEASVRIFEDKKTFFIEEEGNKKITSEEWSHFFLKMKDNGYDNLFILGESYEKTLATGVTSSKLKELYDELMRYCDFERRSHLTRDLEVFLKNKSRPIVINFDWEMPAITLSGTPFRTKKEIEGYANRFKAKSL